MRIEDDDSPLKIDTSGNPAPKNVRAILDSGIEIPCALHYDGRTAQDMRRYLVIAEIDWYKHWVATLVVGEWPSDVQICLNVGKHTGPDQWLTKEALQYAHHMEVVCEKRISI
jgi:hypothetical protein